MSSNQLPIEYNVTRTVSRGITQKSLYVKDIQLRPNDLEELEDIAEGDFLKVTHEHDKITLSTFGRVEPRSAETHGVGLDENQIGLGATNRKAIGVVEDQDAVIIEHVGFSDQSNFRECLDRTLGIRHATCRVRRAISTDIGKKICRFRSDVKHTLGIEWGDRVVLQSSEGRVHSIKAFPLTEEQKQLASDREESELASDREESETYPPPFTETNMSSDEEFGGELPRIHIPYAAMEELGITNRAYNGIYQPIRVHRDTRYVATRILDDLTTPFVLGLIAVVIGFDIKVEFKLLILLVAAIIVLVSTYFRARQVLLE